MRQLRFHLGYRPWRGVSAGLLVALLFALAFSGPARAGTISVTTTFDQVDGAAPCSVREAVNTANADANSGGCTDANPASADTIKLAGGDYNLQLAGAEDANASGDLDVTESLTIAGAGADASGIDGNGAITGDRVLQVHSGILTISGLTVHDGSASGGAGIRGDQGTTLSLTNSIVSHNDGGGIFARHLGGATVTLTDSTVSDNTGGGGIDANTATLTDSTVSDNTAASAGGGIDADTATLNNSTVSGNTAGSFGGGIFAFTPTLTNSTVSGNVAQQGGGIYAGGGALTNTSVRRNKATAAVSGGEGGGGGIYTPTGSLTVTRSTVSDNDSTRHGGGIFFTSPGTLNVTNSTLSGNESEAYGGGLSTDEGTTNFQSTTINRNVADADGVGASLAGGSGGGIARFSGIVNLSNTILAGNLDRSIDPEAHDCVQDTSGGIVSQGYNLFSSTPGCAIAPATGDATAADPGLALLANNGGKTLTHALLSGSPAVNTGNPAAPGSGSGACPSTDQRGVPRSLGGRCDKGAYERVSCHGKLVNRVGTGGADTLVGTQGADGILALGGNDVLRGGSAGDGLCGGDGNDQLSGEAGPDFLDGGAGTDTCAGGTESDQAVRCETISSIP